LKGVKRVIETNAFQEEVHPSNLGWEIILNRIKEIENAIKILKEKEEIKGGE